MLTSAGTHPSSHRYRPLPKCFPKVLHSLTGISILIPFLKDISTWTSYNCFSAILVISTRYEPPKMITASTVHIPLYLTTHSFFSLDCFLPSHVHPSGIRVFHPEKLPLGFLPCVLVMPSHLSQCLYCPFTPERYFCWKHNSRTTASPSAFKNVIMLSPLASVISVEKSDISFMIVPWNLMCPSPTPLTPPQCGCL